MKYASLIGLLLGVGCSAASAPPTPPVAPESEAHSAAAAMPALPRHYAFARLKPHESFEAARERVERAVASVALTAGDHWRFGPTYVRDPESHVWRLDGVRSYLTTGDSPLESSADVRSVVVEAIGEKPCDQEQFFCSRDYKVDIGLAAAAAGRVNVFYRQHLKQRMAMLVEDQVTAVPFLGGWLGLPWLDFSVAGASHNEEREAAERLARLLGARDPSPGLDSWTVSPAASKSTVIKQDTAADDRVAGAVRAATAILADLDSVDPRVRAKALADLQNLPDEEATTEFRAALMLTLARVVLRQNEAESTRDQAAVILAHLDRAHAPETFERAVQHHRPLPAEAWNALGPAALPALMRLISTPSHAEWVCLTDIVMDHPQDPESIAALPLLLKGVDAERPTRNLVRLAVVSMQPRLIDRLAPYLRDSDPTLRRRAAVALSDAGCEASAGRSELARALATERDPRAKVALQQALVRIEPCP